MRSVALIIGLLLLGLDGAECRSAEQPNWRLQLRTREVHANGWIEIKEQPVAWTPRRVAIIVCDMWDAHHCLNAVRRVHELAPRIDALLRKARSEGATIIHAPSSCLAFYEDHPARQRARETPRAAQIPDAIESWCHWKNDVEQAAGYPIDQTDGGEDDDLAEHARWHAQLAAQGRNPAAPWVRQTPAITIDANDYITDDGIETWNILAARQIDQILLVGVHANMCVLGRPFGLRQLTRHGKQAVLVRDLTDTMYNPQRPPYVNHYSGTDLVIEHIEQYVAPTITSDQIVGSTPLRFHHDRRATIAMLIGEDEYETNVTLPEFAHSELYRDFRVFTIHSDAHDLNHFRQIGSLTDADLLLVSVRRRTPPTEQLQIVRDFIAAGKPVIGIRTASHAFSLRDDQEVPAGHSVWPTFDGEVFGGNYHGHHGNKEEHDEQTSIWLSEQVVERGLLADVNLTGEQHTRSWLYKTSPLRPGTQVILMGRVGDRQPHEPVAWTYIHSGGGRSFYTSLGHPADFRDANFRQLLKNAIAWGLQSDMAPGQASTLHTVNDPTKR